MEDWKGEKKHNYILIKNIKIIRKIFMAMRRDNCYLIGKMIIYFLVWGFKLLSRIE